ncbi:MAG: hypothetical protein D3913_15320, partial [Candidatus Electrothrix sp. LOE1_4_5]|nr:hypothetical protein [Candidatus Electrothrix gigas]
MSAQKKASEIFPEARQQTSPSSFLKRYTERREVRLALTTCLPQQPRQLIQILPLKKPPNQT